MTAANLAPVKALLLFLFTFVQDIVVVEQSGKPALGQLSAFFNLAADAPAALQAIPSLPGSLAGFAESDAEALVEYVLSLGVTTNAHALAIINASLALAKDGYALVEAVKTPPPAAST